MILASAQSRHLTFLAWRCGPFNDRRCGAAAAARRRDYCRRFAAADQTTSGKTFLHLASLRNQNPNPSPESRRRPELNPNPYEQFKFVIQFSVARCCLARCRGAVAPRAAAAAPQSRQFFKKILLNVKMGRNARQICRALPGYFRLC